MSDSMIERVADVLLNWGCGTSDDCEKIARAAIEAMRETTPEIEACFDKYVDEAPHWAELIDAALKDNI